MKPGESTIPDNPEEKLDLFIQNIRIPEPVDKGLNLKYVEPGKSLMEELVETSNSAEFRVSEVYDDTCKIFKLKSAESTPSKPEDGDSWSNS